MKILPFLILSCFLSTLAFGQMDEHEAWKKERAKELLQEDGWINLIGLLWIDSNTAYLNQVSGDKLEVSGEIKGTNIGQFHFLQDSVWFVYDPELRNKSGESIPEKALVYPLEYGKGGGAYYERWKWTVIERGGQFGVRLRDLKHPGVLEFQGLPYYPYNQDFRVMAFFEPKFNQTMDIPNVLGQVIEWKVMGILKFELQGKALELTVLDELGKFFVIFSDQTNGSETYPTGRYLYVDYPDRTGHTWIDFNYAYNPPCAFTAYATCPIPPRENRLEVGILAGEQMPEGH